MLPTGTKIVCKKCSVYFATQVACKAHRCVFDNEDKYLDETELPAEINGGQLRMSIDDPNAPLPIIGNIQQWIQSDFENIDE